MLAKLWFIFRHRIRHHSRVSPASQLKALRTIDLGERCKIHRFATVDASAGPGVRLGDRVSIGRGAMIQGSRGGVRVGARSEVNNYAVLNGAGGLDVGCDVLIGPHACLVSYAHEYARGDRLIRDQGYRYAPIVVGDDVWIGAHAVVLAGVTIGRGAVVGAGSVVTRDVEPYAVVAGTPARLLKRRSGAPA